MQRRFWGDKDKGAGGYKELEELKERLIGGEKYGIRDAVLTLLPERAETMPVIGLESSFEMYMKFAGKKSWTIKILHEHKSEHGGYKI